MSLVRQAAPHRCECDPGRKQDHTQQCQYQSSQKSRAHIPGCLILGLKSEQSEGLQGRKNSPKTPHLLSYNVWLPSTLEETLAIGALRNTGCVCVWSACLLDRAIRRASPIFCLRDAGGSRLLSLGERIGCAASHARCCGMCDFR